MVVVNRDTLVEGNQEVSFYLSAQVNQKKHVLIKVKERYENGRIPGPLS